MTDPLSDPVLEAAVQIAAVFVDSQLSWSLSDCRVWAAQYNGCARDLVKEAARQIDHLRALGAIPPAKE